MMTPRPLAHDLLPPTLRPASTARTIPEGMSTELRRLNGVLDTTISARTVTFRKVQFTSQELNAQADEIDQQIKKLQQLSCDLRRRAMGGLGRY